MKLWVPVALAAVVVVAYTLFYLLSVPDRAGTTSIGVVNMIGLASVVIGVVAAGFILRRSTPTTRAPVKE